MLYVDDIVFYSHVLLSLFGVWMPVFRWLSARGTGFNWFTAY